MKEVHKSTLKHSNGFACRKCKFEAGTNEKLKEHISEQHTNTRNITCSFWAKGRCTRGPSCKYSHSRTEGNEYNKIIQCKYQNECPFLPRCKFVHKDFKPCRYQENCRNSYCNFFHYSNKKDYFLEFPSLKSHRISPHPTQKPPVWIWRPW